MPIQKGVDFVATYTLDDTVFTSSINFNKTEIDSDASAYLNAEDQFDVENATPDWRSVLSAKHNFEEFSLLVRANVYGSYENAIDSAATNIQKYGSTVFFDVEGNYQLSDGLSIAAGWLLLRTLKLCILMSYISQIKVIQIKRFRVILSLFYLSYSPEIRI